MFQLKFESKDGNNEEYKIETISNSAIQIKESKSDYLPGFYYLMS